MSSPRFPISEIQQPHHPRLNKPEPTISAPALSTMAYQGPGWDPGSHLKRDPRECDHWGHSPSQVLGHSAGTFRCHVQPALSNAAGSSLMFSAVLGVGTLRPPQSPAQIQRCESTNPSQGRRASIGYWASSDDKQS